MSVLHGHLKIFPMVAETTFYNHSFEYGVHGKNCSCSNCVMKGGWLRPSVNSHTREATRQDSTSRSVRSNTSHRSNTSSATNGPSTSTSGSNNRKKFSTYPIGLESLKKIFGKQKKKNAPTSEILFRVKQVCSICDTVGHEHKNCSFKHAKAPENIPLTTPRIEPIRAESTIIYSSARKRGNTSVLQSPTSARQPRKSFEALRDEAPVNIFSSLTSSPIQEPSVSSHSNRGASSPFNASPFSRAYPDNYLQSFPGVEFPEDSDDEESVALHTELGEENAHSWSGHSAAAETALHDFVLKDSGTRDGSFEDLGSLPSNQEVPGGSHEGTILGQPVGFGAFTRANPPPGSFVNIQPVHSHSFHHSRTSHSAVLQPSHPDRLDEWMRRRTKPKNRLQARKSRGSQSSGGSSEGSILSTGWLVNLMSHPPGGSKPEKRRETRSAVMLPRRWFSDNAVADNPTRRKPEARFKQRREANRSREEGGRNGSTAGSPHSAGPSSLLPKELMTPIERVKAIIGMSGPLPSPSAEEMARNRRRFSMFSKRPEQIEEEPDVAGKKGRRLSLDVSSLGDKPSLGSSPKPQVKQPHSSVFQSLSKWVKSGQLDSREFPQHGRF